MSIVRYDTAPEQPWRNGRGVIRELHSDNGWRLSLASLDRASEFSTFPGLDRIFIVAAGTIELTIDTTTHRLTAGEAQRFPGEATVCADPGTEPAFALNLMTTRTNHLADVHVTRLHGTTPPADALVVLQGRVDTAGTSLAAFDAIVPAQNGFGVDALVALITVRPLAR